jgi:large repetitive protein
MMVATPVRIRLLAPAIFLLFTACGGDDERPDGGTTRLDGETDDGGSSDRGPFADASEGEDGSSADGAEPMACNNPPIVPPASGTCSITAGSNTLLFRGDLLTPSGILDNAQLLVDPMGTIVCAACDCSQGAGFQGATKIECARGLISPGLINAHDHITFDESGPLPHSDVYEHRHDWRTGRNGHEEIRSPRNLGGELGVRWAELRNILAGTTSINGSGSAPGLVRNLDRSNALEGLTQPAVRYSTFPLGDSSGTTRVGTCSYNTTRTDKLTDNAIAQAEAYTPHIAEGIDDAARNEFLCLSGEQAGGNDVIAGKTAFIHGIGLNATDWQSVAAEGASLIWSPRSNIDLYGFTAQVTTAARLGVRIALGTDWTASGSMNLLRELHCADEYNQRNLGGFFSDRALVEMVTSAAAAALWSEDHLGVLVPGRRADLAIFDQSTRSGYRAIIDATPRDVVLVTRNAKPLYGDEALIEALGGLDGCEPIDVCGQVRRLCVERDTGSTLADLRAAIRPDAYDLFFCGDPPNEPSCVPERPGEFTGMSMADDRDGDGINDMRDLCPNVFDAVRPLDDGSQADVDGDRAGDACDVCPLAPNAMSCPAPSPSDRDGDMVPNETDNCPGVPNADQLDTDRDNSGDLCDPCPTVANMNGGACPVTVYAVKQGAATGNVTLMNVIVTAVAPNGYFVQVAPGDAEFDPVLKEDWSGIFVYTGSAGMKPARGDRINLGGTVLEFFGQIQIGTSMFTVISSGNPLPQPIVVDPSRIATEADRAEALEGVLVEVQNVTVSDIAPMVGPGDRAPSYEFVVSGGLLVNDLMYRFSPFPTVGQRIGYIRGVLRFANDASKIEPRDIGDVGVSPQLLSIEPAFAFLEANMSGSVFELVLTRTTTVPFTASLSSSSASLVVPASITVPAGSSRARIMHMQGAATTSTITITARRGMDSVTARARVYDDTTPRVIAALELARMNIAPTATTSGRVAIDLPAGSQGETIDLSIDPPSLGSVSPRSIVLPRGADTASFTLTAGTSTGTGTVIARLGGRSRTVSFAVTRSVTRPPAAPGDLIITEVHRNPSGSTDEKLREWIEVHNPTVDTISLDGLVFADLARTFTIRGARLVPPGGYVVLAYSDNPAQNGGIHGAIAYGSSDLQLNNGSETVTLTAAGGARIDALAWATGWPGADGIAMCLRAPYPTNNDTSSLWRASVGTYGTSGDRGHPGEPSTPANCP